MRHAMVASNKRHAEVMIDWLGLDKNNWEAVVYGQNIQGLYQSVYLVRPIGGVTSEDTAWVVDILVPTICASLKTIPSIWSVQKPSE